jgi:hypothetical protein
MIDIFNFFRGNSEYKKSGFYFQNLPPKTKIILKTKNSNYEIELLEDKKALICGGNISDKNIRFPKPTIVSLVGSVISNSIIPEENWIGLGMRFEFVVEETQQFIITSEILNAEIVEKN